MARSCISCGSLESDCVQTADDSAPQLTRRYWGIMFWLRFSTFVGSYFFLITARRA